MDDLSKSICSRSLYSFSEHFQNLDQLDKVETEIWIGDSIVATRTARHLPDNVLNNVGWCMRLTWLYVATIQSLITWSLWLFSNLSKPHMLGRGLFVDLWFHGFVWSLVDTEEDNNKALLASLVRAINVFSGFIFRLCWNLWLYCNQNMIWINLVCFL